MEKKNRSSAAIEGQEHVQKQMDTQGKRRQRRSCDTKTEQQKYTQEGLLLRRGVDGEKQKVETHKEHLVGKKEVRRG